MELKTLTTEEQIQVIKEARKRVLNKKNNFCLCYMLKQALIKIYGKITLLNEIQNYIPLFTKENAIKFAQAKPDYSGFWWKRYNYKDRLAFLDWMISELEKQLKD